MLDCVVIVDQKRSRRSTTTIPKLVSALRADKRIRTRRQFTRTLGDEAQGIVAHAGDLPYVLETAFRIGDWWIGAAFGELQTLGKTVLDSSGTPFHAARIAVETAKKRPWGTAVEGPNEWALLLDAALALHVPILSQRSADGWEAVALKDRGWIDERIAARLGISRQAVGKRLRAARYREELAGRGLVATLASLLVANVPLGPVKPEVTV